MPDLNWIKEIREHKIIELIKKDDELYFIYQEIGLEKLIVLWSYFQKCPVYFSGKMLNNIKREYIKTNPAGLSTRQLSRKLDCTPEFINKVKK